MSLNHLSPKIPGQVSGGGQARVIFTFLGGSEVEFMRLWAARGLRNLSIEPSKPWQNRTNESFNGKFRDECLAMNWFYSRAHAKVIIESWRKHYNAVRPYSSLEYQTPREFVSQWKSESITAARVSR